MSEHFDACEKCGFDITDENFVTLNARPYHGFCFDEIRFAARVTKEKYSINVPENEVNVLMEVFGNMLLSVSGDGRKKRKAGAKPPWWKDPSHEAAIFSHLNKWKHGELVDKDSGQHPLVHLAWRALAIAYQETHGRVDPGEK